MTEPMPVKTDKSRPVSARALEWFTRSFAAQCDKGIKKYRTPLMTHNGRRQLHDAMPELADLAQYITAAQMEIEDLQGEVDDLNASLALAREAHGKARDLARENAEIRASLAAAERRAEDAELVAWGLANAQKDYLRLQLPMIAYHESWGWIFHDYDKRENYPVGEATLYSIPTLTPAARAALMAAREREMQ